jgi:hypothetical protein
MKPRLIHMFVAIAILGVSGLVHGMWTHRWTTLSVTGGMNLLEPLSGDVGDWQADEIINIDPAEIPAKAECHSRRFMPLKTGRPVVVSVTSGTPDVVAVHTPDVCYLGAGYKLKGDVTRQSIAYGEGKTATFWVGDFIKTTALASETVRVRWSWTIDGDWQAPNYPRLVYGMSFARAPNLYKLYIVQPLSEDEDLSREDPYRKFVGDLIPHLNRQLQHAAPPKAD